MPDDLVDVPVTITPENRSLGEPCDARSCPLALAVDEVLIPSAMAIILSRSFKIVAKDDTGAVLHDALLPTTARIFLTDFDSWNPQILLPLTIPFRLPRHLLRAPR